MDPSTLRISSCPIVELIRSRTRLLSSRNQAGKRDRGINLGLISGGSLDSCKLTAYLRNTSEAVNKHWSRCGDSNQDLECRASRHTPWIGTLYLSTSICRLLQDVDIQYSHQCTMLGNDGVYDCCPASERQSGVARLVDSSYYLAF